MEDRNVISQRIHRLYKRSADTNLNDYESFYKEGMNNWRSNDPAIKRKGYEQLIKVSAFFEYHELPPQRGNAFNIPEGSLTNLIAYNSSSLNKTAEIKEIANLIRNFKNNGANIDSFEIWIFIRNILEKDTGNNFPEIYRAEKDLVDYFVNFSEKNIICPLNAFFISKVHYENFDGDWQKNQYFKIAEDRDNPGCLIAALRLLMGRKYKGDLIYKDAYDYSQHVNGLEQYNNDQDRVISILRDIAMDPNCFQSYSAVFLMRKLCFQTNFFDQFPASLFEKFKEIMLDGAKRIAATDGHAQQSNAAIILGLDPGTSLQDHLRKARRG